MWGTSCLNPPFNSTEGLLKLLDVKTLFLGNKYRRAFSASGGKQCHNASIHRNSNKKEEATYCEDCKSVFPTFADATDHASTTHGEGVSVKSKKKKEKKSNCQRRVFSASGGTQCHNASIHRNSNKKEEATYCEDCKSVFPTFADATDHASTTHGEGVSVKSKKKKERKSNGQRRAFSVSGGKQCHNVSIHRNSNKKEEATYCEDCKSVFPTFADATDHASTTHGEGVSVKSKKKKERKSNGQRRAFSVSGGKQCHNVSIHRNSNKKEEATYCEDCKSVFPTFADDTDHASTTHGEGVSVKSKKKKERKSNCQRRAFIASGGTQCHNASIHRNSNKKEEATYCEDCKSVFPTFADATDHASTTHGEGVSVKSKKKRERKSNCQRRAFIASGGTQCHNASIHRNSNKKEEATYCEDCKSVFPTFADATDHASTTHGEGVSVKSKKKRERKSNCQRRAFSASGGTQCHNASIHRNSNKKEEATYCEDCKSVFPTFVDATDHASTTHGEGVSVKSKKKKERKSNCQRRAFIASGGTQCHNASIHRNSNKKEEATYCEDCKSVFPTFADATDHASTTHGEGVSVKSKKKRERKSNCQRRAFSASGGTQCHNASIHRNSNKKEEATYCEDCKSVFPTFADVTDHASTTHGEGVSVKSKKKKERKSNGQRRAFSVSGGKQCHNVSIHRNSNKKEEATYCEDYKSVFPTFADATDHASTTHGEGVSVKSKKKKERKR
ncbi:hypothetical protein POM88_039550 [Heracleum sosnowskyi]|uniref:C2H2-type domain-containing protein n=1 Tax=Heracleum sosnowskyi TaxID=360622 RepID=A0AAD8HCW8_9APIA|nr:hypothetical protein POM88_039550 [Heracleum sosnowskyi]